MIWTAIVPFKAEGEAKTRLSPMMDAPERRQIANAMLGRVAQALHGCDRISRTILVSRSVPSGWDADWIRDPGKGLNAAIGAAADACTRPLLVIHGDLPRVETSDIEAILSAAETSGLAIAPDRHRTGTNALAIADQRVIKFQFGEDSFAKHLASTDGSSASPAIIERTGLALDCDTPADAALAFPELSGQ